MKKKLKSIRSYLTNLENKANKVGKKNIGPLNFSLLSPSGSTLVPSLEQNEVSQSQASNSPSHLFPKSQSSKKLLTTPKLRDTKPCVGSYYKPIDWIRPSFSNKKEIPLNSPRKEEAIPKDSLASKTLPLPKKKRRKLKIDFNTQYRTARTKFDKILPENQCKVRLKKNICALAVKGNPEEIGEALSFTHIRENQSRITQKIHDTIKAMKSN